MLQLFTTFSVSQIILFIIILALAVKELITVFDFFYDKIKSHFDKDYKKKNDVQDILDKLEAHEARSAERAKDYSKLSLQVEDLRKKMEEDSKRQEERIDLLTQSDKNSIKSFIVREYHFFIEQKKWIDDFSLDAIEKRFADYELEGGNTYVHTLMDELRALPKCPPSKED